ncbi:hypothetical protein W04_3346 [Pseudoalteromonas sp. SW0106-04]|nr:hypothetical protein W04_3346 [Pseudoalteromonas sp. SW0106-04]
MKVFDESSGALMKPNPLSSFQLTSLPRYMCSSLLANKAAILQIITKKIYKAL